MPAAHTRHVTDLLLVDERHDGQRDRRVDAAEHGGDLFLGDQLARGDHAFGRIGFVVALDQLELASAEQAAFGVDLVDGDGEAARDRLTRLRRRARQGRDVADLDRLLR